MALSRDEMTKLKLAELDNLKAAMGQFQGERMAKLKARPVEEETPEEEAAESPAEEATEDQAEGDKGDMVACPECGKDVVAIDGKCPDCGADMQEEGGESDAERLAELAKARK